MSFGNATTNVLAACGTEFKTGDAVASGQHLIDAVTRAVLVQFPGDPARNATPYVQQCSNLSSSTT
jgi:hypothetical protein